MQMGADHHNGMPLVVIACQVFQSLIERLMPDDFAVKVTFLDYGLHRVPDKMTWTLQNQIDEIEEPSLVMLGYGLCGNGLKGIKALKHTLLIPRTDDCIAILLGSYRRYIQEFKAEPGTYYLTKGWLESGSNPWVEFQEYRQKYGETEAQWLMDMQYENYKRLVFVAHNQDDLLKYRPQALEVAEYCKRWGWEFEEILGSENYVQRLIQAAGDLGTADGDFVVIPPGGETQQSMFFR
jgi:hypothetical protein